jgi:DNA helicase-2/ATP-dependent DNA helicase PcrA
MYHRVDKSINEPAHVWSTDQEKIFDWFESGTGNLIVRARAGCAKTTSMIEGVKRAPERRVLMTAFNKSIADELQNRIENRNVRARTLHSLGMSFCRRRIAKLCVDMHGERARALANRAARGLIEGRKDIKVNLPVISMVAGLHTKIREILVDPLVDFPLARRVGQLTKGERAELLAKVDMVENFAVDYGFDGVQDDTGFWTSAHIVEAALNAVELAKEPTDLIDFADMIFLPLVHDWATPICDLLVVDEAQDMSAAQLKLALAATSDDGRACITGDEKQAIYAFRGADSGCLDRLKKTLSANELGLKTTYRCPKSVVHLANHFVRDYYAAPEAPMGAVGENASVLAALPGDFVLSRTNAALVVPCLDLIRAGKRAYIKGSEIGKAALALVEKLGVCTDLAVLKKKLGKWLMEALAKIGEGCSNADVNKRGRVHDQYDVVDAFIEGSDSYKALLSNIRSTFADAPKDEAIMCSTVHKAKGLEAPNVFLIVDTFRRSSVEEDNICYVAATRAKKGLRLLGTRKRFVEGPPKRGAEDIDCEFSDLPWQAFTAAPAIARHLIAAAAPFVLPDNCGTPFDEDDAPTEP